MRLFGIISEDFINYKEPCMTLEFPFCSMKCNKDAGRVVCHNNALPDNSNLIDISIDRIIEMYDANTIAKTICCQGMEPLDSLTELREFIKTFRKNHDDRIIIYTGYTETEVAEIAPDLTSYNFITIKYGRFVPDSVSYYDPILGVYLASSNQYAVEY